MSNRAGEDKRRETLERPLQHPAVVVKETSSRSMLEHYLYGKNAVRAIDMRSIQRQRISDDPGIDRNNNDQSSVSEGSVPITIKSFAYNNQIVILYNV